MADDSNNNSPGDVRIERVTANTNDEKSAQSDLLIEVRDAIEKQTVTLENLQNNKRETKAEADARIARESQATTLRIMVSEQSRTLHALQQMNDHIQAMNRDMNVNLMAIAGGRGGGGGPQPPTGGGGGGSGGGLGGGDDSDPLPSKSVKQLLEDIRQAIVAQGANEAAGATGADGDHAHGGDVSVGESAAQYRQFATASDLVDKFLRIDRNNPKGITQILAELTGSGFKEEVRANFLNLATSIQRTVSSLVSMSHVTDYVTERFQGSHLDMASTGSISFLETFIPQMWRHWRSEDGARNLQSTWRSQHDQLDAGFNPMALMGGNLVTMSEKLASFWNDYEEKNGTGRLHFEQKDDILLTLFAQQRRAGFLGDIDSDHMKMKVEREMKLLESIGSNTGRTADAVLKMSEESRKEIQNLVGAGLIKERYGESASNFMTVIDNTPGLDKSFRELVMKLASNAFSPELLMGNDEEVRTAFAADWDKGVHLLDRIIHGLEGRADPVQVAKEWVEWANKTNYYGAGGVGKTELLGLLKTQLKGVNLSKINEKPDPKEDKALGIWRWVQRFLSDEFVTAEGKMVIALGVNTLALMANTAALGGAGILKGAWKGLKWAGKAGLGGLTAAATWGAAGLGAAGRGLGSLGRGIGGAAAGAGGALRGLGGTALRALPGVGLLAGLGTGAYEGFVNGDWTSAALAAGAGALGMVPGWGTAGALALGGIYAGRKLGVVGSANAATPTAAMVGSGALPSSVETPQMTRDPTYRMLSAQNKNLDRIASVLEEHTGIFHSIDGNTRHSHQPRGGGWLGGFFGGEDTQLYSEGRNQ